jgi:hypothetical protein
MDVAIDILECWKNILNKEAEGLSDKEQYITVRHTKGKPCFPFVFNVFH